MAFALLNLTFMNQDRYEHFEHFRKAVAIAAGHTEELVTVEGEILLLPKSLSYDALDEIEFTRVFASMMTVCARLLHGMGLEELEAEVSNLPEDDRIKVQAIAMTLRNILRDNWHAEMAYALVGAEEAAK
jgi:hypothetical protein